jgi:3D-(3,5/4)-trihydroxycyclohexane-1,2-dione acylhydrolase (decyclizing)
VPRLTAAQALVRFLGAQWSERDGERQRAVPAMFGIFGHGNVCALSAALSEPSCALSFHQPKHEQAMVHTAIGYAKARRRLATFACTASIGPGATNLVTGAATATVNRLPVLLLPADTFASRLQGPVLQQLQHPAARDWTVNESLRPVSRFFDRIARPEQLLDALPEAMRVLLEPAETGAVTIALQQDVQGEAYDYPDAFFAPRTWRVPRRPPAREEVGAAVAAVRASRRPLILAGGGVRYSGAEDALRAFADDLGIPGAETSAGKGTFAGELALGGIGVNGTRAANEVAAAADLVVCVGTRLTDFTTGSRSLFQHPDVRFVGLNVAGADAAALGGLPLVADAREGLEALHAALAGWSAPVEGAAAARAALERWRAALDADLAPRPGERLTQGQVLRALNEATGPGDWVVAAAGSPPGDLLKTWTVPPGGHAHIEFGFSCMGHEIPAALGIRMAQPDTGDVYAVVGDGTLLMAPTELVTAVQERLRITVVLLVNGGFQSIHGLQTAHVGRSFGNEFRHRADGAGLAGAVVDVDYVALARSLGCATYPVADEAGLTEALERARSEPGASVIVCDVEPRRGLLDSGAWWDLGVAEVSERPGTAELAAAHRARGRQRWYG